MGVNRHLLDSNAITSMANNRSPLMGYLEHARRRGCRIGTCEPVIAELFYGLEMSSSRLANQALILRCLKYLRCWPLDRSASEIYGRLYADLRRRGRPMRVIDIMLAAIAMSLGNCVVVSTDSDLLAIPGLSVENWEIPV